MIDASTTECEGFSGRVLILTPTRRDGEVTAALLAQAGLHCLVCQNLQHLAREAPVGAGAILLTEEVIGDNEIQQLVESIRMQPTWSNLPIVMLMKGAITSPVATRVLHDLGNVTLLERPAPTRSVVSAVQAAVRGRQWQYQIRDQLEEIRAGQQQREQLLESERAARQEAEQASRTKDEFLATLSHELRTPLNAILGWAQIIKMSPRNEEAVLEGIKVINRNVRLQTELIEDLLDMSRIISGKVRLDIQQVTLSEVIDAALESVLPSIAAKGLQLEKTIDPSIGFVSGDPGRLQQVLWNLLANAIKFTPKGGTLQVRARRVQSHVEVSVTDSGEGIAPEFLPQLFERFTQADASSTRTHGGLGLGLSIVRHLVEMHGGTISASSDGIGQGATFLIQLPIHSPHAEQPDGVPATAAHTTSKLPDHHNLLQGLKLLVLDDEADAREILRRFLVKSGATVALAASPPEAYPLLPTFQPDVIISDIGMPIQDGYGFLRTVRSQGLETPAIALTAFASHDDQLRAKEAGFQMHLAKPVDPAELVEEIARLVGRASAR